MWVIPKEEAEFSSIPDFKSNYFHPERLLWRFHYADLRVLPRSLTCGLLSCRKFMLGVDCSDTEGDPRDDVMTGYGEASPFIGRPKLDMGDWIGLEVLMTDGWPTMPPIGGGGGCACAALIGPEESEEGDVNSQNRKMS